MRIIEQENSSRSRWSLRLALFAAQLIIITILLHRFASLSTPIATNLIVVSLIGAAIASLLAILAFVQIWNKGMKGTGVALTGLLVCLTIFAVPLYHLPNLIKLPAINDITTDLLSPPQFRHIAALRDGGSNSISYPGAQFISAQAKAYPDISTLMLERSHRDSYSLVHGVVQDLGWQIVNEKQPGKKIKTGYIEAIDYSQLLGFSDDIVVRVSGDNRFTRIDMRSASRYGRHDLGTNAKRIREMFGVIKTRIARAEANRLDNLARRRIAKQSIADKKKKERERKRRKIEADKNQGPIMLPKANFDQVGVFPNEETGEPGTQAAQGQSFGQNTFGAPAASSLRKPRIQKRRNKKNRRSKKKRKRKKWSPFKEWR